MPSNLPPIGTSKPLRFLSGRSSKWTDLSDPKDSDKGGERLTQILSGALTTRNLLVLTGSGASRAVGGPSMDKLWEDCADLKNHTEVVRLVGHPQVAKHEKDIEHLLSLCLFFTKLNSEATPKGKKVREFQLAAEKVIASLCRNIVGTNDNLIPYSDLLRKLVPRRADFPRTKIFTTNYDLCLERAAESLGMPYLDGFSFGAPRQFHGRWFDYDFVKRGKDKAASEFLDGVFQLLKLHGSVDWELQDAENSVLRKPDTEKPHLVYPRDEKFALSYEQPFLEMISRYQTALREQDTCLFVVGFGFNDHHLVQPIRTALLTNANSFRMVIADFEIESKFIQDGYGSWKELSKCQQAGADITFIEGSFENFASFLPTFSDARRQDDLLNRLVRALEPKQGASVEKSEEVPS